MTLLSVVVTKKNANDVYEKAEILLRDGVDVNECDSINETALHKIAHTIPRVTKTRFIVPIIKLLLNYSANTNRNTHGKTCWEITEIIPIRLEIYYFLASVVLAVSHAI